MLQDMNLLESAYNNPLQTFGEQEVYLTVEEKFSLPRSVHEIHLTISLADDIGEGQVRDGERQGQGQDAGQASHHSERHTLQVYGDLQAAQGGETQCDGPIQAERNEQDHGIQVYKSDRCPDKRLKRLHFDSILKLKR